MQQYRLSVKKAGDRDDMLHKDPATEQCNLDDTQKDGPVTPTVAVELAEDGVRLCKYCFTKGVFE